MILKSLLKVNWKTTIAGLLTGGMMAYVGYSQGQPELMLAGAGAAAGGILGKDAFASGIKGEASKE